MPLVDADAGAWEFDLNAIKQKETAAMNADMERAKTDGDAVMHPWFARAIKRCPLVSDPSDVSSYGELGLVQHAEVMARFFEAFQSLADPIEAVAKRLAARSEGRSAGVSASPDA